MKVMLVMLEPTTTLKVVHADDEKLFRRPEFAVFREWRCQRIGDAAVLHFVQARDA